MSTPAAAPWLALDCSTRGGSVAVGYGSEVLAARTLPPGPGASSQLMPAVDAAVREAGLAPGDLAGVVVGGGPGSFTGLRIAAATAKALVRSLHLPLFAYSGLLATAAARRGAGRPVAALFDARNREVFAGCWSFAGDAVTEVMAPAILPVEAAVMGLASHAPLFTGDGAEANAAFLAEGGAELAAGEGEAPAEALLWLVRAVPDWGRVAEPAVWEPEYLRASGAERIAAARSG